MSFIEEKIEALKPLFVKGGRFHRLYPLFEAVETFLLTPGKVAQKPPFVHDAADLKRVMICVVIAVVPCLAFGIYNVGYQMLAAQGRPVDFWNAVSLGAGRVLPILLVTYAVGGFWEALFSIARNHEINEGFLVTGILYALTLPPTIPLWMVAAGISFGVIIGKEIFGGTGFNILNPALTARAFVFFAYPAQMSGDAVWVAVDGVTKASPLAVVAGADRGTDAVAALASAGYGFKDLFLGFIPGSIGETSTVACLFGLAFLLLTGVASWRIVAGCFLGLTAMSAFFLLFQGPDRLAFFSLPPHWHLVMGGFAFGSIFMATDPVSAAATPLGRWIYGFFIGVLVVLIRMVNPAYPEGVMLAILFMNVFSSLIDHFVVEAHIRRREALTAAKSRAAP